MMHSVYKVKTSVNCLYIVTLDVVLRIVNIGPQMVKPYSQKLYVSDRYDLVLL